MFKIYIGNLDRRTTAEQLRMLFTGFADLEDLVVATDDDGRSRGFAIAMFRDSMRGQLAIETLRNRRVNGRPLVVNEVLKKGQAPPGAAPGAGPRGPVGPLGPRAQRGTASARGTTSSRPQGMGFRPGSRNPRRFRGGSAGPGGPGSAGGPGGPPGR